MTGFATLLRRRCNRLYRSVLVTVAQRTQSVTLEDYKECRMYPFKEKVRE
jgi:hypothetical protein